MSKLFRTAFIDQQHNTDKTDLAIMAIGASVITMVAYATRNKNYN